MDRNTQKFWLVLLVMSLFSFSCKKKSDQNEIIPMEHLPQTTKTFLSNHFPQQGISKIERRDVGGYSVDLTNGTEIDFDAQGNWVEVEARDKEALSSLSFLNDRSGSNIVFYLVANQLTQKVNAVKKITNGYEVTLTDSRKIHFDANGQAIGDGRSGNVGNGNNGNVGNGHNGNAIPPNTHIPEGVSAFLDTYFKGIAVYRTKTERDGYEVYLANGVEIEFTPNGNWKEVKSKRMPLQNIGFAPQNIVNYLTNNNLQNNVKKIERKSNGYEVEMMSSDADYYFDLNGNFIRMKR